MSFVLGLKLKRALRIKNAYKFFQKIEREGYSGMDLVKIASSATISLYLVLLDLCLV